MLKSCRKICFKSVIFFTVLIVIILSSCSKNKLFPSDKTVNKNTLSTTPTLNRTELGTTDTVFLDNAYITESLDFALYDAWIRLDDAIALLENSKQNKIWENEPNIKYSSNKTQETIATAQNNFCGNWNGKNSLKLIKLPAACTESTIRWKKWKLPVKLLTDRNFPALLPLFIFQKD